jgi:hypothetical protein
MGKVTSLVLSVILVLSFYSLKAENTDTKKTALFNEKGYVRGITPARAVGLAELILGIAAIVIAVRAKKRSSVKGAKTAITLGLLAFAFSLVHFFTARGAVFGSGSGKAGAILAFILSSIGIILSGLMLRGKKE